MLMAGLASSAAVCEKTPTGVKLQVLGTNVWELVVENPEGRPYVHPLSLADGTVATDLRPDDHIWHLGLWFSLKFVNGINFWEPAVKGGCEPEGKTTVTGWKAKTDGAGAKVLISLEYAPRANVGDVLLTEKREMDFSKPDANGGYSIRFKHLFTAKKDVVLGRSAPKRNSEGEMRGGYAGLTLRLRKEVADLAVADNFHEGTATLGMGRSGGIRVSQLKAPPCARIYQWADRRFTNPSFCYHTELPLKAGETLELEYLVTVLGRPEKRKKPGQSQMSLEERAKGAKKEWVKIGLT